MAIETWLLLGGDNLVTKEQIKEEVDDRLIELHTMFDLAWEIDKRYDELKKWQDVAVQDCLKLAEMVKVYVSNTEQTLQALRDMLE